MTRSRWLYALLVLSLVHTSAPLHAGEVKPADSGKFVPLEVKGRLSDADTKDSKLGNPCKVFSVTLTKGTEYRIDLKSVDFDAYLRLEDPNGLELTANDDGGGGRDARIVFTPKRDGTYRVIAIAFGGEGAYTLKVGQKPPPRPLTIGKAVDVPAEGLKVAANLDTDDARSPVNPRNPCKVYSLKLKAGETYVIDLKSKQFDTYLHVLDEKQKSLARDDDSGGNLNSRLVFRPQRDGTYLILATAYDRRTGAFELTVRRKE